MRKSLLTALVVGGAAVVLSMPGALTAAKAKPEPKMANDGRAKCYECHEDIKAMKEGSKHAKLSCKTCHDGLDKHIDSMGDTKPVTIIDQALCGKCHKNQYESFYKVSSEGGARKEKGNLTGRSPQQDKLLAPHGFTFEHNEPRGHAFMVTDQFVVDRFQGGRYQYKNGWKDVNSRNTRSKVCAIMSKGRCAKPSTGSVS